MHKFILLAAVAVVTVVVQAAAVPGFPIEG